MSPTSTSLLGMSKCKMQKPGRTTQPKDRLWLAAWAVFPPCSTPESQRPGQEKVRAEGSLSRQVRPAQCRKLGRGWRVGGRTDVHPRHGRGRLFSRQVQCSQCNGFLHEGSLSEKLWQGLEGKRGGGQSLVLLLASRASQAGPVTGRGHLGAEGVDLLPAVSAERGSKASSSRFSGCTPLREIGPTLSRPANPRLLSLETGPCLSMLGSRGTRRALWVQGSSTPRRPPCSPTRYRPRVPGPGAGVEGSERRVQPLKEEGPEPGLPAFLKHTGASRAHNK